MTVAVGATVERLALAREAIRLRASGMTAAQIGERLGVSRSYAATLYGDPDGAKARARKDRYAGSCVVCGKATNGSNGAALAPRYCADHANENPAHQASVEAQTIWTRERILECIRAWAEKHGEPPGAADWNPAQCELRHDPARAERARAGITAGVFPGAYVVYRRFGSWNEAIEAAGFVPRAPHGGGGNQGRRRSQRAT